MQIVGYVIYGMGHGKTEIEGKSMPVETLIKADVCRMMTGIIGMPQGTYIV